ncbi:unnamed protein product, partial [marine sediment metagenome]
PEMLRDVSSRKPEKYVRREELSLSCQNSFGEQYSGRIPI